jgi:hypothetical protein
MQKYHIEKNTVQETLIIPLYGRKVCSDRFFSLESVKELEGWSDGFKNVSAKSYMRGYRDIYNDVSFLHKMMIRFCDGLVNMIIVNRI